MPGIPGTFVKKSYSLYFRTVTSRPGIVSTGGRKKEARRGDRLLIPLMVGNVIYKTGVKLEVAPVLPPVYLSKASKADEPRDLESVAI